MEDRRAEILKCYTCKYYVAHYIKKNTEYTHIDGHCINDKLIAHRTRNKYKLLDNCGCWEQAEDKRAERKQSIIGTINKMEQHLADIVAILKEDNKNPQ